MVSSADAILESLIGEVKTNYDGVSSCKNFTHFIPEECGILACRYS